MTFFLSLVTSSFLCYQTNMPRIITDFLLACAVLFVFWLFMLVAGLSTPDFTHLQAPDNDWRSKHPSEHHYSNDTQPHRKATAEIEQIEREFNK